MKCPTTARTTRTKISTTKIFNHSVSVRPQGAPILDMPLCLRAKTAVRLQDVFIDNNAVFCYNRQQKTNKSLQEYRSGHNEAVLKTVWVQAHGGSNPSASAKKMLMWLRWQSTSLVRMRSPVQVWSSAPKSVNEIHGFFYIFVSKV